MATLIRFAPELRSWLMQHLDRGRTPDALVGTMQQRGMEPRAARAIVEAFVAARLGQGPMPDDSIEMPDQASEPPRLPNGTRLKVDGRSVPVLARALQPTLAVLGNVLDADECRQLIELARPRLQPSTVVDPQTGRDVVSPGRSSYGMFFRPAETPLIARLDRRLSALMNLPIENGEGLQILHYPCGAGSEPHFDFLRPDNVANRDSIARSGQRVSTLVCYLNDVAGGGETLFPETGWAVAPVPGHAVYFEYCDSRGRVEPRSLHAGGTVTQGEKWVATKWMRQRRFVSAG